MILFLNAAPIKIKPVRRFYFKVKASWCEDAVPGWGECTPTTSSQACCKYHRQHRWASQHTTELAVRAVLSSRSRQCMSEDEVKIKSCNYRRCFQANCRQVGSYYLSNLMGGWNFDYAEVRDRSAAASRNPRSQWPISAAWWPQSWLGLMLFSRGPKPQWQSSCIWQWVMWNPPPTLYLSSNCHRLAI